MFIQVAKKKYLRNFEEPKLICVIVQSKGWLSTIVCCSVAKINDLWDGSIGPAQVAWVWSLVVVRMAIELKYRKHLIDAYNI